jgi:hypothetical protein
MKLRLRIRNSKVADRNSGADSTGMGRRPGGGRGRRVRAGETVLKHLQVRLEVRGR